MAKSTDIIKNFELMLLENASKQHSNLYSGRKPQISGNNQSNRPLDVDKVISDVSRQIKAIQSADCMKKTKSVAVNLSKYKKSSFVPVNMLHGGIIEAIPQNTHTNKFETQCVSDTQLINIVQDAEELGSPRGMTQEFDTTFNTQELVNISPAEKQTTDHDNNDGLNDENEVADGKSKVDYHDDGFLDENEVKECSTALEKEPSFPIIDISLKEPDSEVDIFEEDEDNSVVQIEETSSCADTQIPDNASVVEDNNIQTRSDVDIPSSPVFNVKTVKKSSSPPPLVFDLESFEEFEKIAFPILEENPDKEAANFLINSQILDKELVLQPERSPVFFEDEYQVSPVIEKSHDKFKFDEDVKLLETDQKYVIENISRQSCMLKDEILFSSDEENECGLQQYCVEDLPFTCALATSFYEQPDVLDKTMYVGFQTASNKSIQICTESFYKAKSFLDDFDKGEEKPSLTELVDMCDVKSTSVIDENLQNYDCFLATNRMNSKHTISRDAVNTFNTEETTSNIKSVIELPTLKDLSEKSLQLMNRQFEGFKTASNKRIRLSEKALQQSKNVFKDIDFGETETCTDIKTMCSKVTKEKYPLKQTENEALTLLQEIARDKKELNLDDSILLEFENNDMSHENIYNSKVPDLVRFITASNKDILISDAALEKSKSVFQDIDETDNINDENAKTDLKNRFEPPNVGFKMASNKEIKISDQALAKTKNVFQDIELNDNKTNTSTIAAETYSNIISGEDIWNQPSTSKTPFVGFKTGNNNKIKISDAALAKTKMIFHDIDKGDMSMNNDLLISKSKVAELLRMKRRFEDIDEDISHNLEQTTKTSVFLGFQTPSNKRIKMSDEALRKGRKIFDTLDQDDSGKDIIKKNSSNKESKGFQTISEEPVTVPKKTVEKSINIFGNIDENFSVEDSLKCNQMPVVFKGFQTASNKPINISEQALIKSNKIFEDMDKNINGNAMKQDTAFKRFQTASNKRIRVSEKALAKSKKIFEHISVEEKDDIEPPLREFHTADNKEVELSKRALAKKTIEDIDKHKKSIDTNAETGFIGFQTASNKKVKVSAQALARSRKILEEIDLDKESTNATKQNAFKGFQTACNKRVNISAQALARNRKILEEIDVDKESTNATKQTAFKGFQSASNKRVNISPRALARSRKILEEIDLDKESSNATKETAFIGFQTASNKKVNISPRALAKSRKILEEIDVDKESTTSTTKETAFIGFQTASNKKVNISAQALARSRKILEDIDVDKESTNATKQNAFKGFQTACNKRVNISAQALARNRKILEEIDVDKESTNATKQTAFKGFQSASNKRVNISPRALARSRKILEEIDLDKESSNATKETAFIGFQTASNKKVNISPRALAKSRKILEEIDVDKKSTNATKETGFIGFQTASNKIVKISEQAFARSRKIFENIDIDKEPNETEKERTIKGFQTASNMEVKISGQVLVRRKKIFENIDVQNASVEEKCSFQGFNTANNAKVNISEDALVRSKKIFENLSDESHSNESFKGAFEGFQTASNKQVKISEEALARSRKIFENIDIENSTDDVPTTKTFQGFHTGNNTKVNVSEQALAKSRKLFEHIDKEKNDFQKPKGSPFKGFQTASKREVKITKEALAKTKHIFEDIDNIIPEDTDKDPDIAMSQVIPVKGANNSVTRAFKDSFREPDINADSFTKRLNKKTKIDPINHLALVNKSESIAKDSINLESVIDTQVMKDFNESLNTEDFKATTPAKSKRSGSPILSCRRAKRRKKFETPYNKTQKAIVTPTIEKETNKTDDIKQDTNVFDSNYKKTKKYNLKDVLNMEKDSPETQSSIDPYILEHTFGKLLKFEFIGKRNELSNEIWTTEDLKKYFLISVNENFVPDGWLDNHLKLIIWKLISYEIKFPKTIGVVCTSRNVLEQLKYRYDKELFNSERPVLRKIMEKDDVSTKLMVLCVVAVLEDGATVDRSTNQKTPELLLTDGWYCIRAILDRMLSELVSNGKIAVGAKLATSGAELAGCDQGVAPWEDTSQIRLKLSGNSTRRARWDARLGYHGNGRHGNGAIRCRLRDAAPGGGRAARLRLLVTRVYPALYVDKFDDGSTVTRSERLELLHQMKYENERQALLEKLYEEVQKEFADEDSQDSEMDPELKRQCLDSGSQISKAMKMSKDPSELRSHLTDTQLDLLADHTTRKRDRLIQDIQARMEERMAEAGLSVARNVVPVLKVRVADARERGGDVEVTRGLMSIWKPNDAITEIVKEGTWIEVMNVIPTAIRYSEIQISAGRQSVFTQSKYKESDKIKPYTKSMKRSCYTIKDLARNPAMTTEYSEVDTVGIAVLIEPSAKEFDSKKNQFQNVYLADADKNMICVNFWGGIKKLGYENILDTGQVVACLNLQKRAGNTRKRIPQYRVTEFSYFTKTPKSDEARSVTDDLEKKLLGIDRVKFCDDCVTLKNNYSVYKMQNYNENVSPYRYQNVDLNLSKNRVFIDSPLIAKNVKNDENLNLSGLDFESTFKQVDTQEYSPRTMLRKRQVKEKLEKLKMYGEPPALSPVQILNRSKNAGSAFKSPLPKSDIPTSVANVGEILPKEKKVESSNIEGSPVIMDRTFVKRINVNPVKLDFNRAVDESTLSDKIDHFAEEFDGSPPLSLD